MDATRKRILVVEDDPAVRGLICTMLEQNGYEMRQAAGADQVLEDWDREYDGVDLVITDIVMPGMDGHELARRLRTKRPDLPVLFVSGYSEDEVAADICPENCDFLAKPFTIVTLAGRVEEMLSGRDGGSALQA